MHCWSPKAYSEVLDPLASYPALKPTPRSDPRPEAHLSIRRVRDSPRDQRAVLHKGPQLDVVVRAGKEHDGVAFKLLLFFRRRAAWAPSVLGVIRSRSPHMRTQHGAY